MIILILSQSSGLGFYWTFGYVLGAYTNVIALLQSRKEFREHISDQVFRPPLREVNRNNTKESKNKSFLFVYSSKL